MAETEAPTTGRMRELVTRSGLRLGVRPAGTGDEALLEDFFRHVSHEDLRFRFLTPLDKVSRDQIALLTHVDHRSTENLLAFAGEALVATAMLAIDPDGERAEVAISVRSDHKGRGIGWCLLEEAARFARARGVRRLVSIESRDNHQAIELEREMGFTARAYPDDPTLVLVEAELG